MQWEALFQKLSTEVETEHSSYAKSFKTLDKEPLHDDYATISFKLSYGGGQMSKSLHLNKEHEDIANHLMANKNVQRIAGFQSGRFHLPISLPLLISI
ncbi:hypothetical protein BC826DRAFT_1111863 [Russula brevipes]|nr:hypothetical protein BC826DRAFT_1111863 [Russula brevipes]